MKKNKYNRVRFITAYSLMITVSFVGLMCLGCNGMAQNSTEAQQENYNDTDVDEQYDTQDETMLSIDDMATVVEEYTVNAEVFRVVNGFYKDALRKEMISIIRLSNGITILKDYLGTYKYTAIGREKYSSLPGYEYQCISMNGNDIKVYAYNERDKKLTTKK